MAKTKILDKEFDLTVSAGMRWQSKFGVSFIDWTETLDTLTGADFIEKAAWLIYYVYHSDVADADLPDFNVWNSQITLPDIASMFSRLVNIEVRITESPLDESETIS